MEVLAGVWTFILGAVLGSFLGVVIWRVPIMEAGKEDPAANPEHISLVNPKRSFCETCHHQIMWYDNIPIVSYCVLRGRCRYCKTHLSIRYPVMELLTACSLTAVVEGAFAGIYSLWMLPNLLYLAAISIVVAYIDIDHHLILNVIVYPSYIVSLLTLALASLMTGQWGALGRAVVCGIILMVFYFILSLIWPGGMGDGDIKLALLLGLTLGWLGVAQFVVGAFLPFLVGGLIALVQIARKKVTAKGGIPFGPSMVIGTWIAIFAGAYLADLYLRLVGLS